MDSFVFPFSNVDNYNLIPLLNGEQHNYPLHIIDSMMYNPFQYYENNNVANNIPVQFSTYQPNCNYYFCDENVPVTCESNSCLNLLALNISSIPRHLDSCIDQCINVFDMKFDILGFCETRLSDPLCHLFPLQGYDGYFTNKDTHGGGVAIYIRKLFQVDKLYDVCLQLPHIESLFLKVSQPHNFIIGMLYRHPNTSVDAFLESISVIVAFVSTCRIPVYIMGDFNINIVNHDDVNAQNLVNLFHSYHFFSNYINHCMFFP